MCENVLKEWFPDGVKSFWLETPKLIEDNGLLPGRRQVIIWTSAGKLLIGPLVANSNEISIDIYKFSFKKKAFQNVVWKMAANLSWPQCVKTTPQLLPG